MNGIRSGKLLFYIGYFIKKAIQLWIVIIFLFWLTSIVPVHSAMALAIIPAALLTGLKYREDQGKFLSKRKILILAIISVLFLAAFIILKGAALLGITYVAEGQEKMKKGVELIRKDLNVLMGMPGTLIFSLIVYVLLQTFAFGPLAALVYRVKQYILRGEKED